VTDTATPTPGPDLDLARAAVRRLLADEHRILLRTLVRDDVARAVYAEAMMRDGVDPGDVDAGLVQTAIEQIKAVRVTYAWYGEEPTCGAEPEELLAGMGCKPCGLPAGHDAHRYPYPLPAAPEEH
jgi:hypothetical protein